MPFQRSPTANGRCRAQTRSGRPCAAPALRDAAYCSLHADPDRASKLGRKSATQRSHSAVSANSSGDREYAVPKSADDVKRMLAETMADVRAGRLSTKIGTTLAYIGTALLR